MNRARVTRILTVVALLTTLNLREAASHCDGCDEEIREEMVDNIREALERTKGNIGLLQMAEVFQQFLNASQDGNIFPNSPMYTSGTSDLKKKWVYMIDQINNMMDSYRREMFITFNEHLFSKVINVSPACQRALFSLFIGAKTGELWTMKMYDSWGHMMPFGSLAGTIASLGDYDECTSIRIEARDPPIYGKYVLVQLRPALPEQPKNYRIGQPLFSLNGTKYENTGWNDFAKNSFGLYSVNVTRGVCVPSACNAKDVEMALGGLVEPIFWNIYVNRIYDSDVQVESIGLAEVTAIIVATALVSLVIVSSLYEFLILESSSLEFQWRYIRFLKRFSALSNSLDLLDTNCAVGQFSFLHGLICMGVMLVILVNASCAGGMFEALALLGVRAKDDVVPLLKQLIPQLFINIGWLIDFFMVTNGFVLAARNLIEDANGKVIRRRNIFLHVYQTWLRLGPAMISSLLLVLLLPLVTSGPLSVEHLAPMVENCRKRWYFNLLFISNLWDLDQVCMYSSWFFSIAFQLNIMTFFVLYCCCRRRKLGLIIPCCIVVICSVCGLIVHSASDTPPFLTLTRPILSDIKQYLYVLYGLTSASAISFSVGFIGGFLYTNRTFVVPNTAVYCSVILSLVTAVIPYYWNKDQVEPSFVSSLIYVAVHRTIWSTGITLVIYSLATERICGAKSILSILTHGIWRPLSRLSAQILTTHIVVVWYYYLVQRVPIAFRIDALLFRCFGIAVVSVIVAYLCYIFIELPVRVVLLQISSKTQLLCENNEQVLLDDATINSQDRNLRCNEKLNDLNRTDSNL